MYGGPRIRDLKMLQLQNIKFSVGGEEYKVSANDVGPETTLNTYLRKKAHLTGTKRMCLEGGCGACIVAVEEIVDGKRNVFAVNSCLVSILSCHGWKIHTIDGIGNSLIGLHPIQKLLADNDGTQCGFCSPGMVMNMFALHESGQLTKQQIENSFGGNICRCTGYRPILTAFKKLASDADEIIDIEDLKPCHYYDYRQRTEEMLSVETSKNYCLQLGASKWIKVHTLKDLTNVLKISETENYMLVGGNTGKGVYHLTILPEVYIDITSVKELTHYSVNKDTLVLGANLTLSKTMDLFEELSKQEAFHYLSVMRDHLDLVATIPVRNIGTIAGNLMIKYKHNEFPSDIFVLLETFNATLVIVDADDNDILCSPNNFLKVDMRRRVIKNIILPALDDKSHKYLTYKIMPRAQNAHAMVNAGFLIKFENDVVQDARIVYGGINPQFVHAKLTENALKGKKLFDNGTLQIVFKYLEQEIKPDYVLPDPTPQYRQLLSISLFYKFNLNVCPKNLISSRNTSGGTMLQRPVSSGIQEYGRPNKDKWPLTEPIHKLEGYAQTSGQAKYVDDMPDQPNQLYAAFVTAEASANSLIVSVDASLALKTKGVVRFLDKRDIPGSNTFMPKTAGYQVEEELFCSGEVQYYAQPIGLIVAVDQEVAWNAAKLVNVKYKPPTTKPYLDVRDVVKAGVKDRITHQTTVVPNGKGTDVKHVVKGEFFLGQQYHYHMEVQCCNVIPTDDEGLDIYPSTQWMDANQMGAAAALNIPTNKINVFVKRAGGAFGGKITRNTLISTASAVAAYKLKAPVRMTMPMEKNMDIIGKRYPLFVTYEVGVDDKGVIQYFGASYYTDIGKGGNEAINSMIVDIIPNCYDSKYWGYSTYTVVTDTSANCYTRAPGTTEGLACIESIMDHIASTLNLEPSDVRAANMNPTKFPKVINYWKEMETWGDIVARKKAVIDYNKANRWKKRGISLVPMAWTMEAALKYSVFVSIFHKDGGVVITHGGIEIGQGINTKVAQMCAYKFGIHIDLVSVKQSYNCVCPNDSTTGGSMTTDMVCYAAVTACETLIERMKPIKNKMKNPTWAQLINQCFNENIQLSATGFCAPNSPGVKNYKVIGIAVAEVEVDILTGLKEILRVDIIEDVGESMNPYIDIGQIEGAFVMGIGYYTTEEIIHDGNGKLMTNRSWTYKPPGAKDIPLNFRIKFADDNHEATMGVLQSKVVAEPPFCLSVSVPLAIRNALSSARKEADSKQGTWIPFDGPTTVEETFLQSLNDYKQYTL
ncbi:unnamed protein product [Phaedon cochleariae]|uniref:Indole-3-acetaldehyde oxidase n=1 Tax=Phaedon cochleariae TaxID=80249 RepID=A0A9P0GM76_PHACE|nr:unnamed protein product [Phaedon cochleariae]